MNHKNERELQKACLKHARALGMFARKVETPNYRGFPDCIFIHEGRVFFVEFKHPNGSGRLSSLQAADIATLERHDQQVFIINNYAAFSDLCRKIINKQEFIIC
jgi:hypothetical protein